MAFSRASLMGKLECFRKPSAHSQAKFLGAGVWEIEGSHYFGDVTIIGPKPDMGMSYPCSFRCPDTRRGVLIIVPERKVNRPGSVSTPPLLAPWPRLWARAVGRFFPAVPGETTVQGATPTPAEERIDTRILRAWAGEDITIATAWDNIVTQDEIVTEEAPGGSRVVALWQTGPLRLAMIEGPVESDEGYWEGYDEGFGEVISGDLYGIGYGEAENACLNSLGYDLEIGWPYDEINPIEVPPGHNEDWETGYQDGVWAAWTIAWEAGYQDGGCSI